MLAIVTGGTRGIGKAISQDLTNQGFKVIATFNKNEAMANKFSEETGVNTAKWDVANYQECIDNIKRIEDQFSSTVSVLVNNAGISRDGIFHKLEFDQWHEVVNVNLNSCFNMCRAVIPQMRQQNFGRIVNISSINALSGRVGSSNYSAAKAGILGLTKSLAKESASKGITVNAIAPGYVLTDLLADVPEKIMNQIQAEIPVGRFGTPDEIARLVRFLVAPESGFITGETISINGGHHMQ